MGPPIIIDPEYGWYKDRFATSLDSTDGSQSVAPFIWTWQESLLAIPLGLIVIGTIMGNFLVLYSAATRSHSLRLPTHYLIANLALADFLVGVLVMPFLTVLQLTGRWYFGSVYCESWTVIHFWLCSASILSTCAVCIERYIGVRFPLKHKQIMNNTRIWSMISCVWILAGLLAFSCLYIWPQPKSGLPYVCDINQQIGHVILAVVGILYIPAVVMIVLYLKIYVIASRHLKFMKKHSSAATPSSSSSDQQKSKGGVASFFKSKSAKLTSIEEPSTSDVSVSISTISSSEKSQSDPEQPPNNPNSNRISINIPNQKKDSAVSTTSTSALVANSAPSSGSTNCSTSEKNIKSKKQINLAKRLSLLVGILLATYLPFFTLYLVMAFHPGSINPKVFNAFGWIRYFNSCINPFIYAFAVPDYRKAMKSIIFNGFGKVKRVTAKPWTKTAS